MCSVAHDFSEDKSLVIPTMRCLKLLQESDEHSTITALMNSPYVQLKKVIALAELHEPDLAASIEEGQGGQSKSKPRERPNPVPEPV